MLRKRYDGMEKTVQGSVQNGGYRPLNPTISDKIRKSRFHFGGFMTREDKQRNKEHCKDMPFDIKLQCWFKRNKEEIADVIGAIVASVTTAIMITVFNLLG